MPMIEEEEEEELRETLQRSLVEKHTPNIPFFENQGVSLQQRLMEDAARHREELEAAIAEGDKTLA